MVAGAAENDALGVANMVWGDGIGELLVGVAVDREE